MDNNGESINSLKTKKVFFSKGMKQCSGAFKILKSFLENPKVQNSGNEKLKKNENFVFDFSQFEFEMKRTSSTWRGVASLCNFNLSPLAQFWRYNTHISPTWAEMQFQVGLIPFLC